MLMIKYKKFVVNVEKFEGFKVFGDWKMWGNPFLLKDEQEHWKEAKDYHDTCIHEPNKRKFVREVEEFANVSALKTYMHSGKDRRNFQVTEYVNLLDNGQAVNSIKVKYYQSVVGQNNDLQYQRLFEII